MANAAYLRLLMDSTKDFRFNVLSIFMKVTTHLFRGVGLICSVLALCFIDIYGSYDISFQGRWL